MRLTIPTIGSYGDVQPYVALGIALRGAGLKVRLATHAAFEGFVRAHGLDFSPIGYDFRALQETEAGQKLLDAGNNAVLFIRRFARLREPLMRRLMADCWLAKSLPDFGLEAKSSKRVHYGELVFGFEIRPF